MKNEREERETRAVAMITEHRGPEWASPKMVRAMLAFADDELGRAAFRVAELAMEADANELRHAHAALLHAATTIRAMKGDGK